MATQLYYPGPYGATFVSDTATVAPVTVEEMMSRLEFRLSPDGQAGVDVTKGPRPLMLQWLNDGQSWAVSKLDRELLTTLEVSDLNISLDASGRIDLTADLTYEVLQKTRFDGFQHDTSEQFHHIITWDQYRKEVNDNKVYTTRNPIGYRRGIYLYFKPFSSGDTGDLYYRREPATMRLLGNDGAVLNGDCEFTREITVAIIEKATEYGLTSMAFEHPGLGALALKAEAKADTMIKDLNATTPPSDDFAQGLISTPRDVDAHRGNRNFLLGD